MRKQRYNTSDNDLIWESLMNKTQHKSNKQLEQLWEQDLEYVEQFLIAEGLMDTVKKGFGAVKDFAADKLLKPVMNFLAGIIAKDPQMAQKAQAAAAQGPEALQQLAATEGDPTIAQQLQSTGGATTGESHSYKFNMNQMICDALVEERLITSQHAQIIQEKYYRATINELHTQMKQDAGCPWMPATVVSENAVDAAAQIAQLMKSGGGPKKVLNALMADDMSGFGEYLENEFGVDENAVAKKRQQVQQGQDQYGSQGNAQPVDNPNATGAEGETPADPNATGAEGETPADPNATGAGGAQADGTAGVQAGGETAPEQPTPDPDAGGQGKPGLISKVWNFIKSNKGAIGGAAAMGLAAAIAASTGNPLAFSYLVGGLAGGVKGAMQGFNQTQGSFGDKVKGAINKAGTDSMKAGGLATVASGIGQMASGAMNAAPAGTDTGPVGAQGPVGPEGVDAQAPAAAPFEQPADSKIEGDFAADAANMRNTPNATPDTSAYTGAEPTATPTPMDAAADPNAPDFQPAQQENPGMMDRMKDMIQKPLNQAGRERQARGFASRR